MKNYYESPVFIVQKFELDMHLTTSTNPIDNDVITGGDGDI